MLIGGFQKFSLSDFPGHSAAIVFTQGCNFRCGWCHNGSLIPTCPTERTTLGEEKIMDFLAARAGMLDGVVITGGEPTLQRDLPSFIARIRELGYLVKLDTNGSNPAFLASLISAGLIDYIAMDVKAPPDKYNRLAGLPVTFSRICESMEIISSSPVPHEFRTTVVPHLLDGKDIEAIASIIPSGSFHRLQKFERPASPAVAIPASAGAKKAVTSAIAWDILHPTAPPAAR